MNLIKNDINLNNNNINTIDNIKLQYNQELNKINKLIDYYIDENNINDNNEILYKTNNIIIDYKSIGPKNKIYITTDFYNNNKETHYTLKGLQAIVSKDENGNIIELKDLYNIDGFTKIIERQKLIQNLKDGYKLNQMSNDEYYEKLQIIDNNFANTTIKYKNKLKRSLYNQISSYDISKTISGDKYLDKMTINGGEYNYNDEITW